jgi:hypothetical protein
MGVSLQAVAGLGECPRRDEENQREGDVQQIVKHNAPLPSYEEGAKRVLAEI